jgi:hypothetical protein
MRRSNAQGVRNFGEGRLLGLADPYATKTEQAATLAGRFGGSLADVTKPAFEGVLQSHPTNKWVFSRNSIAAERRMLSSISWYQTQVRSTTSPRLCPVSTQAVRLTAYSD